MANVWASHGMLTGPHQTFPSESGCRTIRLSFGDRPVFTPEYATSAPFSAMLESRSYRMACSYNALGGRLWWTSRTVSWCGSRLNGLADIGDGVNCPDSIGEGCKGGTTSS